VTIHRSRFSIEALERIITFLSQERDRNPFGLIVEFDDKFGWAVDDDGLISIITMNSQGQVERRIITREDFKPLDSQSKGLFPFV
jgi:hypothetical protein